MKIAVVLHDVLWPLSGGGSVRIYWVIRQLYQAGHDITVLAPFGHNAELPNIISTTPKKIIKKIDQDNLKQSIKQFQDQFPKIKIINLGNFSRFMQNKEKEYSKLSLKIFRSILSLDLDMIYALNIIAALPCYIASKIKHIPLVYDIIDLTTGLSNNGIINRLGPKLELFIAKHATQTITMSNAFSDLLGNHGIKNCIVVPHGVDLDRFNPDKYQAVKKEYDGIYIGGIEKHDDILMIPEAVYFLLKNDLPIRMLIIGNGKMLTELKSTVVKLGLVNNFTFIDWVDNKELPQYIAKAKLGIITHLDCPAGKVALVLKGFEFMAMGLPLIGPNLPGMVEEIGKNNERGKIYNCDDHRGLAYAIRDFINDDRLRINAGKAGIEFVTNNYSWEENANKIVQLCEGVILI